MLTISELLTSPTSGMRSTTDATTQTTECSPQLPSDMEAKNGPPSPLPTWRLPLPQLGIRSIPFQFLPSEGLGEKHRAAQDAATTAAVRCYSVATTVREAIQRIPYLWFTKWTQSANPIYDWEIQDSGNWTTPTESAPSAPSTAPSDLPTLSDDSMDITSTRPTSPAESIPARFTFETPAKIFVQRTVEVMTDDDSESDSDSESDYHRARAIDTPNSYLTANTSQPAWGTPPPTPADGDDMQPPTREACAPFPGPGWVYNTPGEAEYFRFLISNPRTNRACVAPWLKYSFMPTHSTVAATFGANCPVYTRTLRPTPVSYTTKTLTPQETRLFNTEEPFTMAVDFLLQHAAPCDLVAGVQQYRHYRDAANATHTHIKQQQELFMKYLENTLEVLGELENADAFNRLVNLKDCAQLEMSPNFDSMQSLNQFLDGLTKNRYCPVVPKRPNAPIPTSLTRSSAPDTASLARRLAPPASRAPLRTISTAAKTCYKCGGLGHIRQKCPSPHNTVPRERRNWHPQQRK